MFHVGAILRDSEYVLPTKVKPKYLIVLSVEGDQVVFFGLTTSQQYCPDEVVKHGKIRYGLYHAYCFEKGRVIGQNGFSFPLTTFVHHSKNIFQKTQTELRLKPIIYIDTLTAEELIELLYSYNTSNIPSYMKIKFDATLKQLLFDFESL